MSRYMDSNLTVMVVKGSPSKKLFILSGGAPVPTPEGKQKPCLLVEIDGKQINWKPNIASIKNLAAAWGTESQQWVGKAVLVEIGQSFNNKECVIGKPA